MRLLETLRAPVPPRVLPNFGICSGKYNYSYSQIGLTNIEDLSVMSLGQGILLYQIGPPFNPVEIGSKTVIVNFGQPRLGRIWQISRLSVILDSVWGQVNITTGMQFALNLQVFLNGIPVGSVQSVIYDLPLTPSDITSQNSPFPYEFYSDLEIRSGDTLTLHVTSGLNKQLSSPMDVVNFCFKMALQLIGEDVST